MSQENVELWRRSIEDLAACRGEADWEAWLARADELWDRDIVWDASVAEGPDTDIGGIYRGKEAVRRFWRGWLAAWEVVQFEYELVDAGNRVGPSARPADAGALHGYRNTLREVRAGG